MNKRNRKNGAAAARGDKKVTHSERVRGRYLMGCAGKEEEKVGLCVETKISRGFGNAVSQKKTCNFFSFFSSFSFLFLFFMEQVGMRITGKQTRQTNCTNARWREGGRRLFYFLMVNLVEEMDIQFKHGGGH